MCRGLGVHCSICAAMGAGRRGEGLPGGAQGTLFPMCGMNLAFDRKLIGPAMYFGLMGQGQPWGRYDDMWAGWCSKVGPAQQLVPPQGAAGAGGRHVATGLRDCAPCSLPTCSHWQRSPPLGQV